MLRRFALSNRSALVCSLVAVLALAAPAQADWEATEGELGRSSNRVAIHAGAGWVGVMGSDVERVDPTFSLDFGISARAFRSLSVYGSYAISSHDVAGQLTQLVAQNVRPDGRSGNVSGTFDLTRIRVGLRFDGIRTEAMKLQPYLAGGAVFASAKVELATVDGRAPRPSLNSDGEFVNPSSFDRSMIGGFMRAGVEYLVSKEISVFADGLFEVIEPPAGLHSSAAITGGITFRAL